MRLFALRLHKWLCVAPQQPACLHPRRNFATNGLFCLPAVFSYTSWRFCATHVVFYRKSVAFVVCRAGLNNYCLQSITFCNVVAVGNVVFHTRVGNFVVIVSKKKAQCQIWHCALWWVFVLLVRQLSMQVPSFRGRTFGVALRKALRLLQGCRKLCKCTKRFCHSVRR